MSTFGVHKIVTAAGELLVCAHHLILVCNLQRCRGVASWECTENCIVSTDGLDSDGEVSGLQFIFDHVSIMDGRAARNLQIGPSIREARRWQPRNNFWVSSCCLCYKPED